MCFCDVLHHIYIRVHFAVLADVVGLQSLFVRVGVCVCVPAGVH